MSNRTVYLVEGSEDGVLGIYGSAKRAARRAVAYASYDGEWEASKDVETVARAVRAEGCAHVSTPTRASTAYVIAHDVL